MEGLSPLHRRVAGIDVHRMRHVVTVLIEQPDGSVSKHSREFGGFKRDCRALAEWLAGLEVQLVVMESTGIYWKSVYAHLENAGITAWVVNAHFIKHVPGRKTDMLDSEWLAVLARFGLVRGSFIPPKDLRELRLVSRYRRKLNAMCSSQINRLHKMLDDAGIKLGAVVSDIHGVSARAMVRGLIEGQSEAVLLSHARGALKRKTEELAASLDGDLSERHLFVLRHLSESIDALPRQLADIDAYLMRAMPPYAWAHRLRQTLPASTRPPPRSSSSRSGKTWRALARPSAWLAGPHSVRAITRAQANANRVAPATATTPSDSSCANAPTPLA